MERRMVPGGRLTMRRPSLFSGTNPVLALNSLETFEAWKAFLLASRSTSLIFLLPARAEQH